MEDPKPDFSFLVEEPKKLKLAYLHLVRPLPGQLTRRFRQIFGLDYSII